MEMLSFLLHECNEDYVIKSCLFVYTNAKVKTLRASVLCE